MADVFPRVLNMASCTQAPEAATFPEASSSNCLNLRFLAQRPRIGPKQRGVKRPLGRGVVARGKTKMLCVPHPPSITPSSASHVVLPQDHIPSTVRAHMLTIRQAWRTSAAGETTSGCRGNVHPVKRVTVNKTTSLLGTALIGYRRLEEQKRQSRYF